MLIGGKQDIFSGVGEKWGSHFTELEAHRTARAHGHTVGAQLPARAHQGRRTGNVGALGIQ